jgi:putative spermidine/putrescine transport system substrate-binding protein
MKTFKWASFGLLLGSAVVFASAANAKDTVVLASFGSLWQDSLEKALQPFEAENNVEVRFTAGSSTDNVTRAIAAKNNPDVDVVMGEEMTFTQGLQAGIFAKLDPKVVTNLSDVVPQGIMGDGVGVGIIMQTVGMYYNTESFKKNGWAAPTSWSDLVDPKYCHRVGFQHPNVSFGYYAIMMIGGGEPADIPAGIKKVVADKDCIDTIEPSASEDIQRAQVGDIDMGVLAHQLVVSLADKGAPLKFVTPKEGGILQFTTMAVTKNSPHPAMAQKLVNELLSKRVQEVLVKQFKASPSNKTVTVPPELIADGAPNPNDLSHLIPVDATQLLPHRAEWTQQFVRAMAE